MITPPLMCLYKIVYFKKNRDCDFRWNIENHGILTEVTVLFFHVVLLLHVDDCAECAFLSVGLPGLRAIRKARLDE